MTHKQILEKLGRFMPKSVEHDVYKIVNDLISYEKLSMKAVLDKLMPRWNCVLNDLGMEEAYKAKVILTITVLLHKCGLSDTEMIEKSLKSIDLMNDIMATTDAFFRQTSQIKEFIQSTPIPLSRRPPLQENITLYRPQDVFSFQLNNRFYAGYVHRNLQNEAPVVEFYDAVFDEVPTIKQLEGVRAASLNRYNDGVVRISKFAVYGMKYLEDYANQVNLIKACVETPPDNSHLAPSIGSCTISDIIEIQRKVLMIGL